MFFPEGQVRVHVYGRPVDMRKSYDGLYALTRQELGQDPLNGRPVRLHQSPRHADEGALLGPHRLLRLGQAARRGRFLSDWRRVTTREMDWTGLKLLLEGIEAKVVRKRYQTFPQG
jgi:transposase